MKEQQTVPGRCWSSRRRLYHRDDCAAAVTDWLLRAKNKKNVLLLFNEKSKWHQHLEVICFVVITNRATFRKCCLQLPWIHHTTQRLCNSGNVTATSYLYCNQVACSTWKWRLEFVKVTSIIIVIGFQMHWSILVSRCYPSWYHFEWCEHNVQCLLWTTVGNNKFNLDLLIPTAKT